MNSSAATPHSPDDQSRTASSRTEVNPSPATRRSETREVVRQQKQRFGGMKFGACFFGWLTATGTAVLLTALITAVGAGVGLGKNLTATPTPDQAQTIGLFGGIGLLVVIFIAYVCGGYVAGRMARFNGAKQGLGVWLWAIIIAIVVAVLTAVAGSKFNILGTLNGFPRIPVSEGTLTTGGIIAAIALVIVALVGAVLGGLTGMRYHRRIDRADLSTV